MVQDYFPFAIAGTQPPTTANGGIYWFADDANEIYPDTRIALVCFDLAEEKCREAALPPDLTRSNIIPRLGLARDCLCMLTKKKSISYFDLWVLKGDSTWAKLLTIPRLTRYIRPVCFAKDGAFLLNVGGDNFLMYDSKDNTFTKFWVQGVTSWTQLIVYTDSLVSPCTSSIGTVSP